MAIDPYQTVTHLPLVQEEAVSRLVRWCEPQGASCQQVNASEWECRLGERSTGTFSGLMLGSFSGFDKWPVKAKIEILASQAQPAAPSQSVEPVDRPKFCFNCGSNLPVEGRFCPECGNPIPGQTSPDEAGPAPGQAGVQVSITVSHDMPKAILMGQLASGPFKAKYEERLAQAAAQIQQAWG